MIIKVINSLASSNECASRPEEGAVERFRPYTLLNSTFCLNFSSDMLITLVVKKAFSVVSFVFYLILSDCEQ